MPISPDSSLSTDINTSFIPQKSRGSSLICLTGDKDFEKNICYRARERGLLFNEYGLWKWVESPPETWPSKDSTPNDLEASSPGYWSLMNCPKEEDIFKLLGMENIDPTRRNFSFVSSKTKTRKKRPSTPVTPWTTLSHFLLYLYYCNFNPYVAVFIWILGKPSP